MMPKVTKLLALVALIIVVTWVLFGGRIGKWMKGDRPLTAAAQQQASGTDTTPAAEPDPSNPGRQVLYWYDPMHPAYKTNKPGTAPDCGMQLVPKFADEGGGAAAPGAPKERKVLYWYDAMNPTHHYDKPGKAPDGMDLVPQYANDSVSQPGAMPAGAVKISAQKQQLIGVRTATVEREPLVRTVRTTGQLVADETKLAHVHVKINGYVDKVYVDYVGQLVKKGQPLFTLYSPDLVATEEEYLIAKRGDKTLGTSQFKEVSEGAQSLLRAARERLKLWDISDEQIKRLDESGEVSRTLTFYSPVDGFVMDRKAFPQTAVTPDMDLYQITDLSKIWVNADIYEYEVPFVKVGQTANMHLSYYPGRTYTGKISYIYPTVDPMARTVKVRIEFSNPKLELKPQMFADVELRIGYGNQVLVPQEAVLDSGNDQVVFVARGDGYFEPRKIQIGPKLEGKVVVLAGLKPGESIVTSGNFLIDSESQLKDAMGGMKH